MEWSMVFEWHPLDSMFLVYNYRPNNPFKSNGFNGWTLFNEQQQLEWQWIWTDMHWTWWNGDGFEQLQSLAKRSNGHEQKPNGSSNFLKHNAQSSKNELHSFERNRNIRIFHLNEKKKCFPQRPFALDTIPLFVVFSMNLCPLHTPILTKTFTKQQILKQNCPITS